MKHRDNGAECPNCTENIATHEHNGCILFEIFDVARVRGEVEEQKLLHFLATVDANALWDDLGRIVDRFESGGYSE